MNPTSFASRWTLLQIAAPNRCPQSHVAVTIPSVGATRSETIEPKKQTREEWQTQTLRFQEKDPWQDGNE
jgi:hypothetical protein